MGPQTPPSTLPPSQFGTHSLLALTLVHHTLSIVFLKRTLTGRSSVLPSSSEK